MVNVKVESFDKVCRICLLSGGHLSAINDLELICSESNKKCIVREELEKHTDLKFEVDDGKPQNICENCVKLLFASYNFFELCLASDKILTDALTKTIEVKEIDLDDLFDNDRVDVDDDDYDDEDYEPLIIKAEAPEESEPPAKIHHCLICEKEFRNRNTSRHMLKVHYIDVKTQNCLKCNDTIDPDILKDHAESETHISTICLYCNEDLESIDECYNHQLSCSENQFKDQLLRKLKKKSKFSCIFCEVPFESFEEVFDHFLDMHKKDNDCIFGCGKSYTNHKFLSYHVQVVHGKKIGCRNCILAFETQFSYKEHCKSNEHNNFCEICNKKFEIKSAFNTHKESHQSYKFKCDQCAAVYMRANNLKRHIKRDHEGHRYLCQECGKSFTLNYLLEEHIRALHGEQCDECGVKVSGSSANDHKRIHKKEGKTYEHNCIKCKKSFETEEELFKHVSNHKQLKCETCGETFILQTLLTKHMRIHHTGFKYKHCSKCQKEFESTREYFKHINTEHKKFKCDMCDKSFTNKYLLKYHIKTHTEGFKHICDYCGRGFLRKLSLDDHVRTHTGQKPYLCNLCGKGFKQKTHLRSHLNSHADLRSYNCRYCDKKFVQHSSWVCHERIHTGEKPYVCPGCGKGFYHSSTMKKHFLTHSENKKGANKAMYFNETEMMQPMEENT